MGGTPLRSSPDLVARNYNFERDALTLENKANLLNILTILSEGLVEKGEFRTTRITSLEMTMFKKAMSAYVSQAMDRVVGVKPSNSVLGNFEKKDENAADFTISNLEHENTTSIKKKRLNKKAYIAFKILYDIRLGLEQINSIYWTNRRSLKNTNKLWGDMYNIYSKINTLKVSVGFELLQLSTGWATPLTSIVDSAMLRLKLIYWDLNRGGEGKIHSMRERYDLFKKIRVSNSWSVYTKNTVNNSKRADLRMNQLSGSVGGGKNLATKNQNSLVIDLEKLVTEWPITIASERLLGIFKAYGVDNLGVKRVRAFLSEMRGQNSEEVDPLKGKMLRRLSFILGLANIRNSIGISNTEIKKSKLEFKQSITRAVATQKRLMLKLEELLELKADYGGAAEDLRNSFGSDFAFGADSDLRSVKLNLKKKLLKKKFIEVSYQKRLIERELLKRLSEVRVIRSKLVLQQIIYLTEVLGCVVNRTGSTLNQTPWGLTTLSNVLRSVNRLSFNFVNYANDLNRNYWEMGGIISRNLELRRRVLRKYYTTLTDGGLGSGSGVGLQIKTLKNFKKLDSNLRKNLPGLPQMIEASMDLEEFRSLRAKKFKLFKLGDTIGTKLGVISSGRWYDIHKKQVMLVKNFEIRGAVPSTQVKNKYIINVKNQFGKNFELLGKNKLYLGSGASLGFTKTLAKRHVWGQEVGSLSYRVVGGLGQLNRQVSDLVAYKNINSLVDSGEQDSLLKRLVPGSEVGDNLYDY